MRIWKLLLLLALLAASGAAVWLLAAPASSGSAGSREFAGIFGTGTRTPTPAERQSLQQLAAAACRCERRLPSDAAERPACRAEFERRLAPFAYSTTSTLCGPASTERICFGEACITTSWGDGACSVEEGRIMAGIWDREFSRSPERYARKANEAVQAFIRGERVKAPAGSQGCAG